MQDLAEHISTLLWIMGALFAALLVSLAFIFNSILGKITEAREAGTDAKKEALKFDTWIKEQAIAGGIINRDKFFEFCKSSQEKCAKSVRCRLDEAEEWKEHLMEMGGALPRMEHGVFHDKAMEKLEASNEKTIEKVSRAFGDRMIEMGDRIQEMFENWRALRDERLKNLEQSFMGEIKQIRELIQKNGKPH